MKDAKGHGSNQNGNSMGDLLQSILNWQRIASASGAKAVAQMHGLPVEHGQGGTSDRGRFGKIWADRVQKGIK